MRRRHWGRTQQTQIWCSHGTERFSFGRRRRRGKGEDPPICPRLTTKWDEGPVSWRGQLCRTNELGFHRMTCSLDSRDYRRFLNQEQNSGQAGVDLCTGGLGTSTSVDQMRVSLIEYTRRVPVNMVHFSWVNRTRPVSSAM